MALWQLTRNRLMNLWNAKRWLKKKRQWISIKRAPIRFSARRHRRQLLLQLVGVGVWLRVKRNSIYLHFRCVTQELHLKRSSQSSTCLAVMWMVARHKRPNRLTILRTRHRTICSSWPRTRSLLRQVRHPFPPCRLSSKPIRGQRVLRKTVSEVVILLRTIHSPPHSVRLLTDRLMVSWLEVALVSVVCLNLFSLFSWLGVLIFCLSYFLLISCPCRLCSR